MNAETAALLDRIRQLPEAERSLIYLELAAEFDPAAPSALLRDEGPDPVETVLLERIDGPFIPIENDFFEQVINESRRRMTARSSHDT